MNKINNQKEQINRKKENIWMIIDVALGILVASFEHSSYHTIPETIILGIFIGLLVFYLPAFIIHSLIKNFIAFYKKKSGELSLENIRYQRKQVINNITKYIGDYFVAEDYKIIKSKLEISKTLSLPTYETLMVDITNKKFLFYSANLGNFDKKIERMLENGALTINELEQVKSKDNLPALIKNLYAPYMFPKLYNFNDLNRVDVIDMTTADETRSYTMESKSGDALMGAIAGSLLSETIFNEYAAAGAVIGASGERKITENVDKKISYEFRVNIYLNDINESCKSIKLYREYELRELIGTLEYIKNNKG